MNALRLVTPPPSPKCFYCPKHRQNLAKGKTVCMIGSNLNPGVPGLTEQCKISALYCLMGHNHKSAMPHLTETIGWICFRPELTFKMIFHFPVGMKNPPIFSPYRMSPSKEFFPVIKVGEPEHDSTAPENSVNYLHPTTSITSSSTRKWLLTDHGCPLTPLRQTLIFPK